MSHFSVLVVTPKEPTQETLTEILQPWHEYECTGVKDQYVTFVDHHDEVMAEWGSKTETQYAFGDGPAVSWSDDRFYRNPTPDEEKKNGRMLGSGAGGGISWTSKDWGDGRGYRAKVRVDPTSIGYREVEVPIKDIYASLVTYVEEYHGYVFNNGRIGRYTNPNKKWDWWVIGGRYSNRLLLKDGSKTDQGVFDQIDFVTMRSDKLTETLRCYDRRIRLLDGRPVPDWSAIREGKSIDEARETWRSHPVVVAFNGSTDSDDQWMANDDWQELRLTREQVSERVIPLTCFAFVKDGQWSERGEMGWFACVSNEKDQDDWDGAVASMIAGLAPTDWITVVDCHI